MGDMSIPAPTYREDWINNEINREMALPWVTADNISSIYVPGVVIHGAGDPRPADTARQLARTLPKGSYIEIPEVGHYPWLEEPEQLRAALRNALSQISNANEGLNQSSEGT